ncbi:MAG: crotonobetainyl-CoA--carnitine CoA-transferase [Alphaproteobacteria bacterium]|nr:crotonobetainyl-CoA--carnitine CoA-transferase [Alphaproteobacteria bacterium]
MDFLYQKIVDVQGIVVEFGCRWGQNLSLFTSLRGIYEPFNRLRKVVGFDSFTGFPAVLPEDGSMVSQGDYGTAPGYAGFLEQILGLMEEESPLPHLRKFEVIAGDATVTVPEYLKRNPETIIALGYFDFDLYHPTKFCLEAIRDRLTRGSVLGFDEANDHSTPGETVALKEVLGLDRYSVRRYRFNSRTSYLVIE